KRDGNSGVCASAWCPLFGPSPSVPAAPPAGGGGGGGVGLLPDRGVPASRACPAVRPPPPPRPAPAARRWPHAPPTLITRARRPAQPRPALARGRRRPPRPATVRSPLDAARRDRRPIARAGGAAAGRAPRPGLRGALPPRR